MGVFVCFKRWVNAHKQEHQLWFLKCMVRSPSFFMGLFLMRRLLLENSRRKQTKTDALDLAGDDWQRGSERRWSRFKRVPNQLRNAPKNAARPPKNPPRASAGIFFGDGLHSGSLSTFLFRESELRPESIKGGGTLNSTKFWFLGFLTKQLSQGNAAFDCRDSNIALGQMFRLWLGLFPKRKTQLPKNAGIYTMESGKWVEVKKILKLLFEFCAYQWTLRLLIKK